MNKYHTYKNNTIISWLPWPNFEADKNCRIAKLK